MGARAGISVDEYLHTSFPDLDREYRDGELVERSVPDYIEFDPKEFKAKFIRVPKLADVPYPVMMEPNLIVEFYSR